MFSKSLFENEFRFEKEETKRMSKVVHIKRKNGQVVVDCDVVI